MSHKWHELNPRPPGDRHTYGTRRWSCTNCNYYFESEIGERPPSPDFINPRDGLTCEERQIVEVHLA